MNFSKGSFLKGALASLGPCWLLYVILLLRILPHTCLLVLYLPVRTSRCYFKVSFPSYLHSDSCPSLNLRLSKSWGLHLCLPPYSWYHQTNRFLMIFIKNIHTSIYEILITNNNIIVLLRLQDQKFRNEMHCELLLPMYLSKSTRFINIKHIESYFPGESYIIKFSIFQNISKCLIHELKPFKYKGTCESCEI